MLYLCGAYLRIYCGDKRIYSPHKCGDKYSHSSISLQPSSHSSPLHKNHDPIAEVVIFVDVDHYLFYSYPYGSVFRFCLIEEGLELLNGLHELASHDDGVLRWIDGVVNNVQAILH